MAQDTINTMNSLSTVTTKIRNNNNNTRFVYTYRLFVDCCVIDCDAIPSSPRSHLVSSQPFEMDPTHLCERDA